MSGESKYQLIDDTGGEPCVAVAMVTYNHENYIREAIESILMEKTDFSVQLVIAEDCSTDNTRAIILEYQQKFPDKIKLILQNKNVGAKKNNVSLFENLTGKYIAALEGDDYWTDPLKLQKQVDFLDENENYSVTFGGYLVYTEGEDELYDATTLLKKGETKLGYTFNLNDIKYTWITSTLTAVFRRYDSLHQDLNRYTYFKDSHIFYELLKKGPGFYFTEIFGTYRRHAGGEWTSLGIEKQVLDEQRVLTEMYEKNRDDYTRSKLLNHLCNIMNNDLYHQSYSNSTGGRVNQMPEVIVLLRTFGDVMIFFRSLFPVKHVHTMKRNVLNKISSNK